MSASVTGLLLGLVLGLRHALEPDHLAAVSVLSAERPGPRRGALLGALWGVGHSLALLAVALVVTLLQAPMSERLADLFELGVAIMLMGLGTNAVRRAVREGGSGPFVVHAHGGGEHRHATSAPHVHVGGLAMATRPLLVGIVHGLAGSGALTALVIAGLPSTSERLLYILLFGVGSVLGMATLSGLVGLPLQRMARAPLASRLVFGSAGLASACLGVAWGWPIAQRLFA